MNQSVIKLIKCPVEAMQAWNSIYSAFIKICNEKIKIPVAFDFESLNVSVATGIIL